MTYFEIPLIAAPQDLTVRLLGREYRMRIRYRAAPDGSWTLDLATLDGVRLANGIPLVTGANLLDQYDELGVGGGLWVGSPFPGEAAPSFNELGKTSRLYFRKYLS